MAGAVSFPFLRRNLLRLCERRKMAEETGGKAPWLMGLPSQGRFLS